MPIGGQGTKAVGARSARAPSGAWMSAIHTEEDVAKDNEVFEVSNLAEIVFI